MSRRKPTGQRGRLNLDNHDWVKVNSGSLAGKVGVIIRNDGCGGVLRGCYDLFFGEVKDGKPVFYRICHDALVKVDRPDPLPFDCGPVAGKSLDELPFGKSVPE